MMRYGAIWELLDERAGRHPEKVAIDAPDRLPLTYQGLRCGVQEVVHTLRGAGIERQDRVALVLPNGPEMAVAFLGASCAAATAPLNPTYGADEYEFYLSDLGAKALVVDPRLDSPAPSVARALNIRVLELVPDTTAGAGTFRLSGAPRSASATDEGPTPGDVALILHTSGTTARPKIVPLTHANLCASAAHVAAALQLSERDRCLNVMPLFHVHGLVAALLGSLAVGGSVICTPGFYVTSFFLWMDRTEPTWYTAVPTMHQSIAARAAAHREVIVRRPLRFIRSSSSPLAPAVMAEVENLFSAPVIEAYGMTEAAHQIASNPLPPGVRKPGSVGVPAGPDCAIMDESGKLLPAGETGEIVIRGPNVTSGYDGNAEANARAFAGSWFRTGDLGRMDADGYLYITSRLKEIIDRGGEKIAPREIEEVLLSHSAVAQAVVFAVPDARLGEDVGAAVVLRPGQFADEAALRVFAATRLAHFKVPRVIRVLAELPKGPTGKVQRIGLAERLGIRTATPQPSDPTRYRAPRTPQEKALAAIWVEILGLTQVGVDDSFLDLGGDSMLATQLVSRVRESFGLSMTLRALFDAPTIAAQAAVLEQLEAAGPGVPVPPGR